MENLLQLVGPCGWDRNPNTSCTCETKSKRKKEGKDSKKESDLLKSNPHVESEAAGGRKCQDNRRNMKQKIKDLEHQLFFETGCDFFLSSTKIK